MPRIFSLNDSWLSSSSPPRLTSDPDSHGHFFHEARGASALDHSSICAIHFREPADARKRLVNLDKGLKRGISTVPASIETTTNESHVKLQQYSNILQFQLYFRWWNTGFCTTTRMQGV
jgi:hypothetical protein